jgi:predicted ATPase
VIVAYAYRNGKIIFSRSKRDRALPVAKRYARNRRYREVISTVARHGYKRGVLLVPGIPEAVSEKAALEALLRFNQEVIKRLQRRPACR